MLYMQETGSEINTMHYSRYQGKSYKLDRISTAKTNTRNSQTTRFY